MAVRGLNNASRPLVALSALAVLAGCARAGADAPVAAPEASTPTPTLAAPAASARQAAQRQAKIEQALAGQQYLDDPAGQWAISATASSTYATALAGHDGRWTPEAATGAPDAESVRYPEKGWAPEQATGKRRAPEWLELRYDTAVSASAVRVRQVGLPGRLRRIELIDQTGARHVVWNGPDRSAARRPADHLVPGALRAHALPDPRRAPDRDAGRADRLDRRGAAGRRPSLKDLFGTAAAPTCQGCRRGPQR